MNLAAETAATSDATRHSMSPSRGAAATRASSAPKRLSGPNRARAVTWIGRAVAVAVLVVLVAPMMLDASVGVWSGALAIGLAFAPVAVGVYLTFRILDFPDLTVDASFPAGAAAAAVAITNGWSPWIGLAFALVVGALFGALTGIIHVALRINSLLASILTVTAAFTINLRIQGRANVPLLRTESVFDLVITPVRDALESLFGATGIEIHRSASTALVAAAWLAVIVVVLRWLLRTEVGIALRATGANPDMARANAIDVRLYVIGGVALSNALIGTSGAIVAQHQGFADVNSGAGLIIAGLAAVIIGEVLFAGRGSSITRHLLAAAGGMIVYRAAISLALASDIDLPFLAPIRLQATDVRLATAVIVGLLLAIPRLREWRAAANRRKATT